MATSPEMVRRLAFVKYLFKVADGQARGPELLAAISLLGYHDAIELFLKAACDQAGVDPGKKAAFDDYWTKLSTSLSRPLPQQAAMRRLNSARVNLKHHGNLPAVADLQDYRRMSEDFFEEATPIFFGMAFADISLIEFVEPNGARDHLQRAREHLDAGALGEAGVQISAAFVVMLDEHQDPLAARRSVRSVTPGRFHRIDFESTSTGRDPVDWRRFTDALNNGLAPMRHALQLLMLGLDIRKYQVFATTVPEVRFSDSEEIHATVVSGGNLNHPGFRGDQLV